MPNWKKKHTVKDYLNNIEVGHLSGDGWSPDRQWNLLHGDDKSTTDGNDQIKTMKDSKCTFIAKIVGALDSSPVTIAAVGAAELSLQEVVDALKAKFG